MSKKIVTEYKNIYKSSKRAKRGKKYHSSLARFDMMELEGVHMLKEQLESGKYTVGPYSEFKVYEPKERKIMSCQYKDKVIQHCLCDYILHPALKDEFIQCNAAGQKNKGTLYSMDKLKDHMLKHYREHGTEGYILKCDIRKFFYEIDHEILKDIVDYHFPDGFIQNLNHIYVDSTEGKGLPLGNQVAQVYALLMLNGMDHMITGELGIQCYGRYMDDFYLIHHSKAYLKECLSYITMMVESLGLELNEKTQTVPIRHGIKYLGFHHYITEDGKYIRKVTGEKKRAVKKKIRQQIKQVKAGKMTMDKFMESYNSRKAHLMQGNCYKLCQSLDLFVKEMLEEK